MSDTQHGSFRWQRYAIRGRTIRQHYMHCFSSERRRHACGSLSVTSVLDNVSMLFPVTHDYGLDNRQIIFSSPITLAVKCLDNSSIISGWRHPQFSYTIQKQAMEYLNMRLNVSLTHHTGNNRFTHESYMNNHIDKTDELQKRKTKQTYPKMCGITNELQSIGTGSHFRIKTLFVSFISQTLRSIKDLELDRLISQLIIILWHKEGSCIGGYFYHARFAETKT